LLFTNTETKYTPIFENYACLSPVYLNTFHFVTEAKPDPPRNLSVTGVTESTVGLKWEPPELDGGSPITGYVVEMRPTSKKAWTKVEDTKSLELTASKLTQGTEYLFRVAAQNAVGVSEFVELQQPAVPKSEFGKPTKRDLLIFGSIFQDSIIFPLLLNVASYCVVRYPKDSLLFSLSANSF